MAPYLFVVSFTSGYRVAIEWLSSGYSAVIEWLLTRSSEHACTVLACACLQKKLTRKHEE